MRLRPESRIGGAACKSSGSPDPLYGETAIFRLEAAFSFWPYCGDTCCPPPPWGRRRARISVAGARLRFVEPSQSERWLCCKASCPNATLHTYPDENSPASGSIRLDFSIAAGTKNCRVVSMRRRVSFILHIFSIGNLFCWKIVVSLQWKGGEMHLQGREVRVCTLFATNRQGSSAKRTISANR